MSGRGGETLGAVYAEALAGAADAKGLLADVGAEIAAFAQVFAEDRRVRAFFLSGAIRREAKANAIERVVRGRASDVFADFLHVLLKRQRFWAVPDVADAYVRLLDRRLNRVPVTLETAAPVAEADLALWVARLRTAVGKEPILSHRVKPSLIGGAVVRVGDVVADGSVRRRLSELRARIRATGSLAPSSSRSEPTA